VKKCTLIVLAALCLFFVSPRSASSQPSPGYLWIGPAELAALPTSGPAWDRLYSQAHTGCGRPDLSNQEDTANVCVLAKALVFARTGKEVLRVRVADALRMIVNSGTYHGRALALGRELGTYAIAADLIGLPSYDPGLDASFRAKLAELLVTPTIDGPANLIQCHELRPNNWGTMCGASRVAVAAYLGDSAQLARAAQVFRGYLGERHVYAGFKFGADLTWQCDPNQPTGINPAGCISHGKSVDGVMPDDQRRAGSFSWPPPKENYTYEALQGALVQAVILTRSGYDPFTWGNYALYRAFQWLHTVAKFPAEGDDSWEPYVINYYYGTNFPTSMPTRPGKSMGFTDWTLYR
jgi:hypothetical protein